MNFKLIMVLVSDDHTDKVIKHAREMGATGATVITSGYGEGLNPHKTFFGLTMEGQVDMVLFIVEQSLCSEIMEGIAEIANFKTESGTGIAMQLNIEDAIGLKAQWQAIENEIEDLI